MIKNKTLFKSLFVLAILMVGILYSALPHFVRHDTLKEQGLRYIPLTVTAAFDHLNIHVARYRDVIDGDLFPDEIDTIEHEGGPMLWPILTPFIMSPFFMPFDSVFPGIVMTDFVFPILLFIALFFTLYAFTRNKWFALFSAYVIVLFPQLTTLIPPSSIVELKTLVMQFIPFSGVPISELNFLARDSYIPSGFFFVGMFYFVYQALTSETRKKVFIVLGGVFYGLLFYLYFYFWVFATIFLGLLFLIFLFTKSYSHVRTVFLAGITGVIVSVPFWINQYNLSQLPSYGDIIARMGIEEGHGIRWFLWKTYILHTFMALAALYLGKKFSKKILGFFLAALALTGIVAYNIQVVTGFSIQSDHWGNKVFLITNAMILPPLFYYGWLYVAPYLKRRYFFDCVRVLSVAGIIVAMLLTVRVVEGIWRESVVHALDYTVETELMAAYEWLNENTPKDSVVMTPSTETNIELAAYTHNRIFQARAQNNLLSKEEVLERLFITQKFFGISPEQFYDMLQTRRGVFNFFTAEYNSRALDSALRPENHPDTYQLPEDVLNNLLNTYTQYTLQEETPYRLDYIFVGPREKVVGVNTDFFREYEKIYEQGEVLIYEYNS